MSVEAAPLFDGVSEGFCGFGFLINGFVLDNFALGAYDMSSPSLPLSLYSMRHEGSLSSALCCHLLCRCFGFECSIKGCWITCGVDSLKLFLRRLTLVRCERPGRLSGESSSCSGCSEISSSDAACFFFSSLSDSSSTISMASILNLGNELLGCAHDYSIAFFSTSACTTVIKTIINLIAGILTLKSSPIPKPSVFGLKLEN